MDTKDYRILTLNPGSSSTKMGVFQNERLIFEKTVHYDSGDLSEYKTIVDQYVFRKETVLRALDHEGINLSKLNAVCGRGGLLRPIEGGTYEVNELMLSDLKQGYAGQHVSNLGGIIAHGIASGLNIPAFIVDPVVVDEMAPYARLSGIPAIERKSIFHALNQKAAARRTAKELNKRYEDLNLIVVHMGSGITIGVHKRGKVIDVNNGLHGDGPFSSERAGTIPAGDLVALCYSGKYYQDEVMKMIVGQGGLAGYLGTSDMRKVEKLIDTGNEKARFVLEGMAYQVAKEIGAASTAIHGKVDAIILTGNLARAKAFVQLIIDRVNWIADVTVHPGENELQALAEGALRVLLGEEQVKHYTENKVNTTVFL